MRISPLVTALSLALTACGGADEADVDISHAAEAEQGIWIGGKQVKINPSIAHWRKDLEAQFQAHPQPLLENPAVTSVSPNPVLGGQTLTITGTRFLRMTWLGRPYTVSFQAGAGRISVAPLSTTDTQIRVLVPANATTGLIRLLGSTGAQWAESALPLNVTIPAPTTGTVRFTNDSQFEVSILDINGQPMIPWGQVLPPGGSFDVTGPGGLVPYHAEVGFGLTSYYIFDGSVNIINGQTVPVALPRVRASLALTQGAASATFDGPYTGTNFDQHVATMVVRANGTYDLYSDNVLVGSAQYVDGAFLPNQSEIRFVAGGVAASIDQPYQSFLLRNGPPSWPSIQYSRR